jgi:pimeloyl-ACP methyl ester carboxylesterase
MAMLIHNSKVIHYKIVGNGPCIVFLHGYLESKEVWDDFIPKFKDFTIITPDLPGHGDSEPIHENQTMEQMASTIKAILDYENFAQCTIYGHSMGGYVAEAFCREYPEMVNSVGLIHSTIYADSEEKRNNRMREIELIRNGKKAMVVSGMLPNVVAPQNFERLKPIIEEIIERAKMFPAKGIIAVLNAMMKRSDHIVNINIPFHLIAGDKDKFIPIEIYNKMKKENPHIHLEMIKGVGHASFLEDSEALAEKMLEWI